MFSHNSVKPQYCNYFCSSVVFNCDLIDVISYLDLKKPVIATARRLSKDSLCSTNLKKMVSATKIIINLFLCYSYYYCYSYYILLELLCIARVNMSY